MSPHSRRGPQTSWSVCGLVVACLLLTACAPIVAPNATAPLFPRAAQMAATGGPDAGEVPDPFDQPAAPVAGKPDIPLFLQKTTIVPAAPDYACLQETRRAGAPAAATNIAELTVRNETDVDICFVYLSPASSDVWGEDWLGAGEIILSGHDRLFELPRGRYDLRVDDCNHAVVGELRDVNVRGAICWLVSYQEKPLPVATAAPVRPTPQRTPKATPAPTRVPEPLRTPQPTAVAYAFTEFLCCGIVAGDSFRWGISYPTGWEVELTGEPDDFVLAQFFRPDGRAAIVVGPLGWVPRDTPLNVDTVDAYLDAQMQQPSELDLDYTEFMRRGVPGVPNARISSVTWHYKDNRYYDSTLYIVTPVPHREGGAVAMVTIIGVQAEAAKWAESAELFRQMMFTLQITSSIPGAEGNLHPGPADEPQELEMARAAATAVTFWKPLFCPVACQWEVMDTVERPNGDGWVCSDGCAGLASPRACGRCY